ncbi:MAG: penicillin-insensitive murein endopeptidase, partial [Candidatus Competibacter denitrificans]
MKATRFSVLSILLVLVFASAQAGNGWSDVGSPLSGQPEVIGSFTSGCIVGARTLPLVGDGYQVMRSSRNRYYGHPVLIQFLERLSRQAAANGSRLLIGDLGQPRGGPMPGGHRSHQTGLDAD